MKRRKTPLWLRLWHRAFTVPTQLATAAPSTTAERSPPARGGCAVHGQWRPPETPAPHSRGVTRWSRPLFGRHLRPRSLSLVRRRVRRSSPQCRGTAQGHSRPRQAISFLRSHSLSLSFSHSLVLLSQQSRSESSRAAGGSVEHIEAAQHS